MGDTKTQKKKKEQKNPKNKKQNKKIKKKPLQKVASGREMKGQRVPIRSWKGNEELRVRAHETQKPGRKLPISRYTHL